MARHHKSSSIPPLFRATGQRKYDRGLWVKIRIGRDLSTITVMGKTRSDLGI